MFGNDKEAGQKEDSDGMDTNFQITHNHTTHTHIYWVMIWRVAQKEQQTKQYWMDGWMDEWRGNKSCHGSQMRVPTRALPYKILDRPSPLELNNTL